MVRGDVGGALVAAGIELEKRKVRMNGIPWHGRWIALAAAVALVGCAPEAEVDDVDLDEPVAEAPVVAPAAGFGEFDADRDARLASNEFGTWADRSGVYDRWNTTADAGLDEAEFGTGALGLWDADRNRSLSEGEWNEGVGSWFGDGEESGTFADWDLNDDNLLDDNELGEGFNRTGMYGRWDANRDSLIDENEYNEGLFGLFDSNRDTFLDENEWNEGYGRWGEGLGA
jgi:hypothetical protein